VKLLPINRIVRGATAFCVTGAGVACWALAAGVMASMAETIRRPIFHRYFIPCSVMAEPRYGWARFVETSSPTHPWRCRRRPQRDHSIPAMRGGAAGRRPGAHPASASSAAAAMAFAGPVDAAREAEKRRCPASEFHRCPDVEAATGDIIYAVLVGQPSAFGTGGKERTGRIEKIVHPAIKAELLAATVYVEREEQVMLPNIADEQIGRNLCAGVGFKQSAIAVEQLIAVVDLAIIGRRPADAEIVEPP